MGINEIIRAFKKSNKSIKASTKIMHLQKVCHFSEDHQLVDLQSLCYYLVVYVIVVLVVDLVEGDLVEGDLVEGSFVLLLNDLK